MPTSERTAAPSHHRTPQAHTESHLATRGQEKQEGATNGAAEEVITESCEETNPQRWGRTDEISKSPSPHGSVRTAVDAAKSFTTLSERHGRTHREGRCKEEKDRCTLPPTTRSLGGRATSSAATTTDAPAASSVAAGVAGKAHATHVASTTTPTTPTPLPDIAPRRGVVDGVTHRLCGATHVTPPSATTTTTTPTTMSGGAECVVAAMCDGADGGHAGHAGGGVVGRADSSGSATHHTTPLVRVHPHVGVAGAANESWQHAARSVLPKPAATKRGEWGWGSCAMEPRCG